jgi:hypothetical protein
MQRGTPFESGNKLGRGRPKGSRNKPASIVMQTLLDHEKVLGLKAVQAGVKDDIRMLLWCVDSLIKHKTQFGPKLKLPPIQTLDDITLASSVVVNAMARHKCTDAHGQALIAVLAEMRKAFESRGLIRLDEIEQLVKKA